MIIGIAGPQEGGKDTIARELSEYFGLDVDRFAAIIYRMAAVVDPAFKPNMSHRDKEAFVLGRKELGTRRDFLRKLGTGWGRDMIHEDIWAILTTERIPSCGLILADVRKANEAQAILDAGGIVIELRPDWTDFSYEHDTDMPLLGRYVTSYLPLTKGDILEGSQTAAELVLKHYAIVP